MRNETLQSLCRSYMERLRPLADKYGLGSMWDGLVALNRRGECEGTEEEVAALSRAVDDERMARKDVPKALGKSYRRCVEDGDFDALKTLPYTGIYSKIAVLLHKSKDT